MAFEIAIPRFASKRMFSDFAFSPPPTASAPPAAEPSTKLFVSARVVTDRVSGYSKGFGFFLDGWVIFAEYARPQTQQPPPVKNTGLPPLYRNY
ncbi:hypothetical protein MKX01_014080 [Papaver californicum]|nr:hypothetical protein MKX01_014080 [Papaver californicum]